MATTQIQTEIKKKKLHPVEARLATTSIRRLAELKRIIIDGTEATEKLIKTAKERSREALSEAMLCGNALLEAKKILGYGKFMRWCKENIQQVSHQTITRYIQLSQEWSQVSNLSATNLGLRQAYLKLGIIDEPTKPGIKAETGSINAADPTN